MTASARIALPVALLLATSLATVAEDVPLAVPTFTVQLQQLSLTTTQPAEIYPYYEAALGTKVSGPVTSILKDIGDRVSKGDTLAEIDAPEIAQTREAYAAIADQERSTLIEIEAAVDSAQADADAAKSEFDRLAAVVKSGVVSSKSRDESQNRFKSAQAKVAEVSARKASAEAAVRVALARMKEAEALLSYATLSAPFDGIVTARNADLGEFITAGNNDRALFTVIQSDPVRIQIAVPSKDAPYLSAGDAVTLAFPRLKAPLKPLTITRTSGRLEPATRTMLAEVEVPNPDGHLLSGSFGQATIQLEERSDALLVDAAAVRFSEAGAPTVYKLEGDTVHVVPVQIGVDLGAQLEIVSGVKAGDTLVGPMLGRLTEGQKVTAKAAQ